MVVARIPGAERRKQNMACKIWLFKDAAWWWRSYRAERRKQNMVEIFVYLQKIWWCGERGAGPR